MRGGELTDEHFGRGIVQVDGFQNGGTVVGDHDFSGGNGLKNLVLHAGM